MKTILFLVVLLLFPTNVVFCLENPVELGLVNWHRSYDKAADQAKKTHKPILVLFQEVPG